MDEKASAGDFRFRDIAPVIEIGCWTGVILAPFLRWINGPAVSTDQLVMQVFLVALCVVGAVGLRLYNWRRNEPKTPRSS